jgi:hypothetical protein
MRRYREAQTVGRLEKNEKYLLNRNKMGTLKFAKHLIVEGRLDFASFAWPRNWSCFSAIRKWLQSKDFKFAKDNVI